MPCYLVKAMEGLTKIDYGFTNVVQKKGETLDKEVMEEFSLKEDWPLGATSMELTQDWIWTRI